jgi:hypothetical protein
MINSYGYSGVRGYRELASSTYGVVLLRCHLVLGVLRLWCRALLS